MFLRRRTSSAFYTHRPRTSIIFVKKSIKMHVSFKRRSFFIHPKKYYGMIHKHSMRNDLEFCKSIRQVKYAVFWNLTLCFFFYIFHYINKLLSYTWKYYNYSHIFVIFSLTYRNFNLKKQSLIKFLSKMLLLCFNLHKS